MREVSTLENDLMQKMSRVSTLENTENLKTFFVSTFIDKYNANHNQRRKTQNKMNEIHKTKMTKNIKQKLRKI